MSTDEHEDKPVEDTAVALTEDNLMKLFGENWAHIRHMEYYRMWCMNIYAVVVAGVIHALGRGNLEPHLSYVAAFLVLFTILNLLITLKIEAVIENFVKANETVVAELKVTESIAPIRTRGRPWDVIKFQWIFTAFYCLALAGISVLIVLHYKAMLKL